MRPRLKSWRPPVHMHAIETDDAQSCATVSRGGALRRRETSHSGNASWLPHPTDQTTKRTFFI